MEEQEIQQPSFWAILPAKVRYDKEIGSTAKIIFSEITALSNIRGYCSAQNQYFADRFGLSVVQVSRIIKTLTNRHFVRSVVEKDRANKRKLFPLIDNQSDEIVEIRKMTLDEMFDDAIGKVSEEWKEEREEFLRYWKAKNYNGKKELWQTKKIFDIAGRWGTWQRNKKTNFGKGFNNKGVKTDKEIKEEQIKEIRKKEKERAELQEKTRPLTEDEKKEHEQKLADLRKQMSNLFKK